MMLKTFISYSHVDEKALERLHKHLAMMQRDGSLESWHDQQIKAGQRLNEEITRRLDSSNSFLALVSPDYLASNYCYEKEFEHALALQQKGILSIVPIILEPCDWLSSPLSQFKALPKDGLPVSQWANQNIAFMDVVTGLRQLSATYEVRQESVQQTAAPAVSKRMKIRKDFDAIDKADFADETFLIIQEYFRRSCTELNGIEGLKAKYERIDDTAFSCTVVNREKTHGEAFITVHNGRGRAHLGDIIYSYARNSPATTANGIINVRADEYNLYLSADFGFRNSDQKLSAEQVAESLWREFTQKAGIEYE